MAFRKPVVEGGVAGRLVKIAAGGHELDDGPFTLAANGGSGAVTASEIGTGADQPDGQTPYWLNIGQDSSGNELFVEVYKNTS